MCRILPKVFDISQCMDILTEEDSEKSILKMTATGRSNSVGTRKSTIFLHRYLLFV